MFDKSKTKTDLPLDEDGSVDNARVEERIDLPGHRTGITSAVQRPHGADTYLCSLVRGVSWRFVGGLVFFKGKSVRVNEPEFAYLQNITDPVNFHDGDGMVLRRIRKFRFTTLDGEPVSLDDIPDEHLGAAGMDPAEAAELDRKFEGDDRPRAG